MQHSANKMKYYLVYASQWTVMIRKIIILDEE